MAGFVKLDCGILNSSLWHERDVRDVFITALLLAEPFELKEAVPAFALQGSKDDPSGFIVPPGWYGFVRAASTALAHLAGVTKDKGLEALEVLCSPEGESRTPDHEGRRMVRVDGGFLILNWDRYRQRDYTSTERSRRHRERKKEQLLSGDALRDGSGRKQKQKQKQNSQAPVSGPQEPDEQPIGSLWSPHPDESGVRSARKRKAPADGFERFYDAYAHKVGRQAAKAAWAKHVPEGLVDKIIQQAASYAALGLDRPAHPATWLNNARWDDDVQALARANSNRSGKPKTSREICDANTFNPATDKPFFDLD